MSGVDHDELFHDRVVDGPAIGTGVGLHDEHVGATNALAEPGPDLTVGEIDQVVLAERCFEVFGHLLGQLPVGPARQERHAFGGDFLHAVLP